MTDSVTVTSIQPINTECGEQIQRILDQEGISYTTGINATELFEYNNLLYNIYTMEGTAISHRIETVIRLLANGIENVDMEYEDLIYLKDLTK